MNRTYTVGALIAFILLAVLVAFSSFSMVPSASPDGTKPTQPVASQTPTQAPPVRGSVGERVEAQGIAMTVTGIEWKSAAESTPAQGSQFLLVRIIVENTNPNFELAVSAGDFDLRRSNGQTLNFSPQNVADDQLEDVTLGRSENITTTVVFELAHSDETLHLLYDYNDQHIDIDLGQ